MLNEGKHKPTPLKSTLCTDTNTQTQCVLTSYCTNCWPCTHLLSDTHTYTQYTLRVTQPWPKNCWPCLHINTNTHKHTPTVCTHTQLVICRDISGELLTLSSSIFQGLAALTTTCHFNTQHTFLLRRLSRYAFPPVLQSLSFLLWFSTRFSGRNAASLSYLQTVLVYFNMRRNSYVKG